MGRVGGAGPGYPLPPGLPHYLLPSHFLSYHLSITLLPLSLSLLLLLLCVTVAVLGHHSLS